MSVGFTPSNQGGRGDLSVGSPSACVPGQCPCAPTYLLHSEPMHLLPDSVLQRLLAGRAGPPPPGSEDCVALCTERNQLDDLQDNCLTSFSNIIKILPCDKDNAKKNYTSDLPKHSRKLTCITVPSTLMIFHFNSVNAS